MEDIINPLSLRFFVVSDLHAFATPAKVGKKSLSSPPSHLDVSSTATELFHPIKATQRLVRHHNLTADVLVCCGDLCDKADPAGMKYAWNVLNELKNDLGASRLLITVGNHDLDSRYARSGHDPKDLIMSLDPRFPSPDEEHSNRFWARHFTTEKEGPVRYVTLNSCAYHGNKSEHEHGRIGDRTIDELRARLTEEGYCDLNVLLCHHHPQKHTEYDLGEYDDMTNGQRLLDTLGDGVYGPWILLHGHKHCPKLTYAAGGIASCVIFSAGSLSAYLYPTLAANVRNQCYLVEFPLDRFPILGLVGTFTAWDFVPGHGCMPAGPASGLPHRGGFGFRDSAPSIANRINGLFHSPGRIPWSDIITSHPEFEFILPSDLRVVATILERAYRVTTDFGEQGEITELEKT